MRIFSIKMYLDAICRKCYDGMLAQGLVNARAATVRRWTDSGASDTSPIKHQGTMKEEHIEAKMSYPIVDIQLAADYICFKAFEAGERISVLKLHKLLYYVQAWHEALYNAPIFNESFEAWVHGPVNKAVFIRYRELKTMYSPVEPSDWQALRDFRQIPDHSRNHIDSVLGAYMHLSGTQLEQLTHEEEPWIKARGGISPFERCSNDIKPQDMRAFYSKMAQR